MYTAIIGMGLLAGNRLNAMGLEALGLHMHTSACHATTIVANLLVGLFPSGATQVGVAPNSNRKYPYMFHVSATKCRFL